MQFNCFDIDKLKNEMSYRDFVRWQLFYNIAPFGDRRGDIQAAMIASTVARTVTNKVNIDDFMLKFEKPKPKKAMDWQEMKAILKATCK